MRQFSCRFVQRTFYVDTCIWIDYQTARHPKSVAFLKSAADKKILLSDLVLHEMKRNLSFPLFIKNLFELRRIIQIEYCQVNCIDYAKGKALASFRNLPHNDCVHTMCAIRNNAIIVTRDSHFKGLQDLCEVLFIC